MVLRPNAYPLWPSNLTLPPSPRLHRHRRASRARDEARISQSFRNWSKATGRRAFQGPGGCSNLRLPCHAVHGRFSHASTKRMDEGMDCYISVERESNSNHRSVLKSSKQWDPRALTSMFISLVISNDGADSFLALFIKDPSVSSRPKSFSWIAEFAYQTIISISTLIVQRSLQPSGATRYVYGARGCRQCTASNSPNVAGRRTGHNGDPAAVHRIHPTGSAEAK